MLKEVASLAGTKLSVTRELNASTEVRSQQDSKQNVVQEAEERKKISMYVKLQQREIESLKNEIIILKHKEAPKITSLSSTLPNPPNTDEFSSEKSTNHGNMKPKSATVLPPIPLKKQTSITNQHMK